GAGGGIPRRVRGPEFGPSCPPRGPRRRAPRRRPRALLPGEERPAADSGVGGGPLRGTPDTPGHCPIGPPGPPGAFGAFGAGGAEGGPGSYGGSSAARAAGGGPPWDCGAPWLRGALWNCCARESSHPSQRCCIGRIRPPPTPTMITPPMIESTVINTGMVTVVAISSWFTAAITPKATTRT